MIARSLFLAVPLLAAPVPALAQAGSGPASLSAAAAGLRHALAWSRLRRASAAPAAPPGSAAPAPAGAGGGPWRARPASGGADAALDGDGAIDGVLDLDTMTLVSARAGRSPRLDAAKGAPLVDGRCGRTALPLEASDNFEVTPDGAWGQEILQLPKAAAAAPGPAPFRANLHVCAYDGDWSDFNDVALTCVLSVR